MARLGDSENPVILTTMEIIFLSLKIKSIYTKGLRNFFEIPMEPRGIKTGENVYFYHGLFYHFGVEREDIENICLYDEKQKIALVYPPEESNPNIKDFFNFTESLKKDKVFYREGLVYKFCGTKKEFEQNVEFFEQHPRVTLEMVFRDSKNLVIITKHKPDYKPIDPKNLPNLRKEFIIALSKFGQPYEFREDLIIRRNIGWNGKDIIFFEQTGDLVKADGLNDMIKKYFSKIKDKEPWYNKILKGQGESNEVTITVSDREIEEILGGNKENPIVL